MNSNGTENLCDDLFQISHPSRTTLTPYRLRMHPTQEWHDLYQEDSIADMKEFLDFYTKGISNGWEKTPRARISVLRFNQVSGFPGNA